MTSLERMILDLAVEDSVGPWELLWRARAVLPDVSESAIRDTVGALLRRETLKAVMSSDEGELDVSKALAALSRPSSWEIPDGNKAHVRLVASEAGADEYYAEPQDKA